MPAVSAATFSACTGNKQVAESILLLEILEAII